MAGGPITTSVHFANLAIFYRVSRYAHLKADSILSLKRDKFLALVILFYLFWQILFYVLLEIYVIYVESINRISQGHSIIMDFNG